MALMPRSQPMTLTLYYSPLSCSTVTYIALTEAGADFQVSVVNMRQRAHLAPEYLRINPKHKVPVLVINGEALTENVAIQLWIARHFPAARLLPAAESAEFQAISLMAWCASGIHPSLTPNVLPQRYCDLPGSEESVRRCAQKLLVEAYQVAEQLLTGRDWFFDHFTLPDAYFFWAFRRGHQFRMDLSAFPACNAHLERVSQRDSVRQLLSLEARTLAELA
jgi:glutathione S-transferase